MSRKIASLVICGFNEKIDIPLPRTYSRGIIPARRSQIPRPETAVKCPHLKKIASHLISYMNDVEVALLIGFN